MDILDLGLLRLFEFLFFYGLMALTHRWQDRHLGVPLNSVFLVDFRDLGTDRLLGVLFLLPWVEGPHPSVANPPPWLLVLLVPFPGGVKLSGWALVVLAACLIAQPLKLGLWTGLHVRSYAWGLNPAYCLWRSYAERTAGSAKEF